MEEHFQRKSNFKPKATMIGEVVNKELKVPILSPLSALLLKIDEWGYERQHNTLVVIGSNLICYQNHIYFFKNDISQWESVVRKGDFILKSLIEKDIVSKLGNADVVGEITDRILIFKPSSSYYAYSKATFISNDSCMIVGLLEDQHASQLVKPMFIGITYDYKENRIPLFTPCFCYRNKIVALVGLIYIGTDLLSTDILSADQIPEEDLLLIKHFVLRQEKAFEKMKSQVEAFERFEKRTPAERESIPEDVRMFVWRRDQGKCVKCGGQANLEFDHIIPVVKGGGNTERNIQLLCQGCNREKSDII